VIDDDDEDVNASQYEYMTQESDTVLISLQKSSEEQYFTFTTQNLIRQPNTRQSNNNKNQTTSLWIRVSF
jgi:hypothetical protein